VGRRIGHRGAHSSEPRLSVLLTVMAAEIAVDGLVEAGMTGVSAFVIGAIGCVLFRRILRSETARQSGVDGGVRGTSHRRSPGGLGISLTAKPSLVWPRRWAGQGGG